MAEVRTGSARRTMTAVGLLAIGAAAGWGGPRGVELARQRWATTSPTTGPATRVAAAGGGSSVDTWTVTRGDLRITFTEGGKLRAIKSYPIFPNNSRQELKITFLAPEGSTVKKDDLLVSFDKKAFQDLIQTREGELEAANRTLVVNRAAYEIAKSTGKSNVAQAKAKLEEADVAYKTYREMEGPKKLNELDASINEARGKMNTSDKAVSDAQSKLDDGLFGEEDQKRALEDELARAKQTSGTLQKSIDAFLLQRKIFRAYEYPQQLKSKKQATESAKMDVEKAQVGADNEANGKQAEVAKVEDQIRRLQREIDDLNDNVKKCDLTAPVDGLVVYGDPSSPFIYDRSELKVGASWYGGRTMMTIPDLSAFEIDIQIAESYVGRVRPGLPVTVTFEAVPGVKLEGNLKEIAKLGRPRESYDSLSPRAFDASVTLTSSDPRMVSGMTGKVEIVADEIRNALLIPMDAIVTEQGRQVVQVRVANGKTERREVKVGRSNNTMVEITAGLAEGERVALGAATADVAK